MSNVRLPKRRKSPEQQNIVHASAENGVQEQMMNLLRANAGAGRYRQMDPVYALSESFSQTFDFVGRQRVQDLAGNEQANVRGVNMLPKISDDGGEYLRKFSEYAFCNGRLAGAILQGRGQLVLHTCIMRSAGMAGDTVTEVRRKVDKTFNKRRVQQVPDDWVHYFGDALSATAMVIDASKTARQALESILSAAVTLDEKEVSSMREVFPFLYDAEDRELLGQLSEKKRRMQKNGQEDGSEYRAVCISIDKTRAVLNRKAQMKTRFLSQLETMLANARAAEEIFQREEYRKALAELFVNAEYSEEDQANEDGANPTGE